MTPLLRPKHFFTWAFFKAKKSTTFININWIIGRTKHQVKPGPKSTQNRLSNKLFRINPKTVFYANWARCCDEVKAPSKLWQYELEITILKPLSSQIYSWDPYWSVNEGGVGGKGISNTSIKGQILVTQKKVNRSDICLAL